MSLVKYQLISNKKSRRDGKLLTGGFNLRDKRKNLPQKSRRDGILSIHNVVPSGLWGVSGALLVRRLKPPVNNMPSLRDFSSNNPKPTLFIIRNS